MESQITKTNLPNGLTVLLKEIHTAPIISSWVWYRVGSRNEPPGLTGVSHWVEHMQFKGTPQFPGGILDKAISREGGSWNAFTYLDWTTFFETMPADKIDLALRLEADRMINSQFDPEEVGSERTVIISEREGNENEPMFKLSEAIQGEAFHVHAYRHEVIGDMTDLRSMQRDDLYNHYHNYYAPNNAVVAVAGDFNTQEMLGRIQELYEPIPSHATRVFTPPGEPALESEKRLEVSGPGETMYLQMAFRAPAGADPDFYPLTVLDSLLTGPSSLNMFGGGGISNRTSRLYRALVEKEFAVSVYGGLQTTIDPYLYEITATVRPGVTPDRLIQAIDDEIRCLQDAPVNPEEIARAIKQARALFAYGSENITNQGFWLGNSEMYASYHWFVHYTERLAEVTPADVQRIAQQYLKLNGRIIGTYLPANEEANHDENSS
ncbi:MAG: pitrilysin family protein [Anaerolineaceae bacterium]|nr:pitrilysin family protein [Anaerolineaceae bacterium]